MSQKNDPWLEARAFERQYIAELFAVFVEIQDNVELTGCRLSREDCKDFIKRALRLRKKTRQISESTVDTVVDSLFDKNGLDRGKFTQ